MALAGIDRSEFERLDRIARADGLHVRRAENWAQETAWGGELAIFEGAAFRFAGRCADNLRAWLHVNAHGRTDGWTA